MIRDLARGYALGRVTASTRGAYQGAWRQWVKWRGWMGEELLVRGNGIRARGSGRAGGIHGILLRGPRKPGVDGSGQTGSSQPLP